MDIVTYALLKGQIGNLSKSLEGISEGMTFKGSVPTESDLPSNPQGGDLYIIQDESAKAVWDGSKWVKFDNNVKVQALDGSVVVNGSKVGVAISKDDNNALKLKSDGLYVSKSGGGGGSGELEDDLTVSNPIGRYKMDEVIDAGTEFESIFRGMLSKTYYPTLTDPSVNITFGAPSLAAVGANITSMSATINFNRGKIDPKYTAENGYRSGPATKYKVNLNGASTSYSDESTTNNQFSIPAFTRESKGKVTLTASVDYSAGVQPKDSDGNNYQSPLPAGSKSGTKTVEFIIPFYYGCSNEKDINTLDNLTMDLTKQENKVYTFSPNVQYMVVAYDASYPNLTSIIDPNGFSVGDDYIKTTLNYKGQDYKVYTSPYAVEDTNAKFTYNF